MVRLRILQRDDDTTSFALTATRPLSGWAGPWTERDAVGAVDSFWSADRPVKQAAGKDQGRGGGAAGQDGVRWITACGSAAVGNSQPPGAGCGGRFYGGKCAVVEGVAIEVLTPRHPPLHLCFGEPFTPRRACSVAPSIGSALCAAGPRPASFQILVRIPAKFYRTWRPPPLLPCSPLSPVETRQPPGPFSASLPLYHFPHRLHTNKEQGRGVVDSLQWVLVAWFLACSTVQQHMTDPIQYGDRLRCTLTVRGPPSFP